MAIRQLLFNTLHRFGATAYLRRDKKDKLTIISLHRITTESDPFFEPIRPAAFDELLGYLKRHYTIVGFGDVPALKAGMKKPPLILSFDDGYYDFVEYAMPILEKHGVRANHNIVNACAAGTALIWTERLNHLFNHCRLNGLDLSFEEEGLPYSIKGSNGNWMDFNLKVFLALLQLDRSKRLPLIDRKEAQYGTRAERRMMHWDEVRQCADAGIEIGNHTYTHDVMSTIADAATMRHEIGDARREMEAQIGRPVNILALPNGQGNPLVDAAVAEAGYDCLLYVGNRVNGLRPEGAAPHIFWRVGVNHEPLPETALRIELFHSKIRN
ncbi:MAG: hypothetical protein EOO11_08680 [Chitinophagaceae bacterium]|nr:MAG: hypothetical protein EOO11_08680 [Chitinophagaceae bacterium]